MSDENLEDFVRMSRIDSWERFYKSGDIDTSISLKHVEVLNGELYEERVLNGELDYLVCYYKGY